MTTMKSGMLMTALAAVLGIAQNAYSTASVTFDNKTDQRIEVTVEYEALRSTLCKDDVFTISKHQTEVLDRSYMSGGVKGYSCSLGHIVVKDGKGVPTELTSSKLPSTGDAKVTITEGASGALEVAVTSVS